MIQTFTLPVRILVTTQDVSLMEIVRDRYSVVEIRSGFTVQESMELFSSYLKIPADYLPTEAKAIHDECKVMKIMMMVHRPLISLSLSGLSDGDLTDRKSHQRERSVPSNTKTVRAMAILSAESQDPSLLKTKATSHLLRARECDGRSPNVCGQSRAWR